MIGSTNATNLTDGLDGLVSMPLIFVFLTFAIFAYVLGNINFSNYLLVNYINGSGEIVIFCTSAIGALLGFLWFNSSPIYFYGRYRISIIGSLISSDFYTSKTGNSISCCWGIICIETISVMLQVTYFKFSKGKEYF